MPKPLFFHISDEKQNKFLNAAIDEFTSKTFEQVSVNTIIKKAGISRGSFYTYFDNLDELFNYIFQSIREERLAYAKNLAANFNGNFFDFIKLLFIHDFDAFSETGKYSLFKNYIHYIQSSKKLSLKDAFISKSIDTFLKHNVFNSKNKIDKLSLKKEELGDLIEVIFLIMINTFLKSENENLTTEETINLFKQRMDYLQFGVIKKGNNI